MSDELSRIIQDGVDRALAASRPVNLNTVTQREIEALPMIDRQVAAALIAARPFRNWEDLVRVEGFYLALVEALRRGGAEIA